MGIPQRYMGVGEAAGYLGLGNNRQGRNTLYQWVHRGRVPCVRVGRALRFDIQALDKHLHKTRQIVVIQQAVDAQWHWSRHMGAKAAGQIPAGQRLRGAA